MKKADVYIKNIKNAIGSKLIQSDSIYTGKDGHLKFAKEIGYALADFNKEEVIYIENISYNKIYVTACNLKPLLDSKQWNAGLGEGYAKAKDYKEYNGSKLYTQIKSLEDVDNYYSKMMYDFRDIQLTDIEIINMLDEIIKEHHITNIVDFKHKMLEIERHFNIASK